MSNKSKEKSNMQSAGEELEQALSKAKKNANLHYYKGLLNLSEKRYGDAFHELVKAIKYADESSVQHYFTKGLCEFYLHQFKEAIENFDIAIRLDSSFSDAYFIKGKCLYLLGYDKDAVACYQELLEERKQDLTMYVHLGNSLMRSGELDDALDSFYNANNIQETDIAYYQQAKVIYFIYILSV